MLTTSNTYRLVHTGCADSGYITYSISFKRKHLGYFVPHLREWQDMRDNNCDFDNLEQCLEGIFDIYEYEKEYEFKWWVNEIKIKVEVN